MSITWISSKQTRNLLNQIWIHAVKRRDIIDTSKWRANQQTEIEYSPKCWSITTCRRRNERNPKAPKHRRPVRTVQMDRPPVSALMAIDVNTVEPHRKRERTHSEGLRTACEMRIHYSLMISMTDGQKALRRHPLCSSNSITTYFSIARPQTIWIKNVRPAATKCNFYNSARVTRRQTTQSFGVAIAMSVQVTRLTAAYRPRCVAGIHFIRRAANAIRINSDVNANRHRRHLNSNGSDIRRVQRPQHRLAHVNCVAANRWPHQRNYHRYRAAVESVRAAAAIIHWYWERIFLRQRLLRPSIEMQAMRIRLDRPRPMIRFYSKVDTRLFGNY